MPQVQFGLSSYQRATGDMPSLPVVNCYVEAAPTETRGIALQSRPGLQDNAVTMGAGPIKQLFKRDLVLSSGLFGVSGGYLYGGATSIGAIAGTGFVSMAGNEIGLMIAAGSSLYFYNGTTLDTVSFPDSASVVNVFTGGSRFWAIRKDTGKIYWTSSLGSTVDALSFATAESLPDRLLQGLWIDGGAILFGSESIEFWQQTGNASLPITPLTNLVIEKGIKATGCACVLGKTFAAVTNENNVIVQNEDNVISNPGLQDRIEASTECSLFTILLDGVQMLVLRIDNETQVWNPKTGYWSEFKSYDNANWLVQCAAGTTMGCSDGKTAVWSSGHTDFGGVLERRFAFGFPMDGGGINIANLRLRCNVGHTPYLTGDYTDPTVEMRISPDAGQTWSGWDGVSLGMQGNYREQPEWRALGMASQPAFFGEFRVTDPVDFRASDVLVNENIGGR